MSNESSSKKHFVCQSPSCNNRCDHKHDVKTICAEFYEPLYVDGGDVGDHLLYVRKCRKCGSGGLGFHDYYATDRCKCYKCGRIYCDKCCFK